MRTLKALTAAALIAGGVVVPAAGPAAAAVTPPPCTTSVASASTLNVNTSFLSVSGSPFGIATTSGGNYAFAATDTPNSVLVLSTTAFTPHVVRTISLSAAPEGVALTPDGKYLLVASNSGAIVISVALAENSTANPVLGTLTSAGAGAIQVAFSADGNFAFVTLEDSQEAAVFNFAQALASGFATSGLVGYIPLNNAPVGMAVSPNGQFLYVTSETITGQGQEGSLSVVNVATAETNPAGSVINTVDAGCNPVRVIASADGKYVWVTARASDALLVFKAAALQSSIATSALLAWTSVREAPVDLAFASGGADIVVADSNRFMVQGQTADLGVVNVADVLAGQPGLVGKITSGLFPRELSLKANGTTLLAANYSSQQVEAVDVSSLP